MQALKILSPDQVLNIHKAALRILEKTGVVIFHEDLLKDLSEAGFKVDNKKKSVWFPPTLVEKCIRKAPSNFVMASRTGKFDVEIREGKTYTRSISGCFKIFNSQKKECKLATIEDSVKTAKLLDALENISFCGGSLYPWSEPIPIRDISLLKIMFENTEKHIFFQPYGLENMKFILEMMDVVTEGRENLKGSLISVNVAPTSPLRYAKNELDILIEAAKRNIPVEIGSTPLAGAASPITLASQLTLEHAEILAGVVISQVVNAGAPVIYEPRPNPMDMRTGNALWGNIEWGLSSAASQQLASYCGLATDFSGTTTESKIPDEQAGIEKSLNAMLIALARPNIFSGMGFLETINTLSFEQLIIDDEICARIFRVLRGIEISEETIAAELINKVGPGGSFLSEDHTLRHFKKEYFWNTIFDRNVRAQWEKEGARDIVEVAHEKAEKIIEKHHLTPLPKEVQKELTLILKRAKDEIVT